MTTIIEQVNGNIYATDDFRMYFKKLDDKKVEVIIQYTDYYNKLQDLILTDDGSQLIYTISECKEDPQQDDIMLFQMNKENLDVYYLLRSEHYVFHLLRK